MKAGLRTTEFYIALIAILVGVLTILDENNYFAYNPLLKQVVVISLAFVSTIYTVARTYLKIAALRPPQDQTPAG